MIDDSDETSRMVEETKEYYRQRASQFGDWHRRTGKYEGGAELDASYFDEAGLLFRALEAEALHGDVLELAAGTGIWTEAVAETASSVTALDASEEMLERCRSRLGANPKVRYVVSDFYDWTPDREYDWVTFSFWISHVPASRLDEFVRKVSGCLRPMGRVFFVDQQVQAIKNEDLEEQGGEIAWRTLETGRRFKVLKHFYTPEEIQNAFLAHGINIRITQTPKHFFWAQGKKSSR